MRRRGGNTGVCAPTVDELVIDFIADNGDFGVIFQHLSQGGHLLNIVGSTTRIARGVDHHHACLGAQGAAQLVRSDLVPAGHVRLDQHGNPARQLDFPG